MQIICHVQDKRCKPPPTALLSGSDPWAKHHAWRQHALFTRSARIGTMFPGLGIATVAFAAYLGYEYVTAPKAEAHHGEAHH
ncbi:hypothetical protein BGZ70_008167 [Mortierella alpina]|uniref:Uncharacterized protein n=1 Tax=Mortierella alpina TaxID=64518 RepID=A0A9P6J6E3_MORAP|nr:hypothetical protein BGZ70_008167 [Mortierella alpina]